MKQKQYWLKYKDGNLECLFRSDSLQDLEKHCTENNITKDQITEIIKWI